MNALVWAANLLGWPIIHLVVARTILHRSAERYARDSWLTRERRWEHGGALYRQYFLVHRWKRLLPDGAPWLGGMAKKRLAGRSSTYLRAFVAETRRAESAHWYMLFCTPLFYLWNPPWACAVMTAYGIAANLPCIFAQRANRLQLKRIIRVHVSRVVPEKIRGISD
jgi:glycosyl-4,4'-diaponeurosporenoate acyltransferase